MTTFLIISLGLYIFMASFVAETARDNGRNPLKWFFIALAVNPLIAQPVLYSRIVEGA